MVTDGRHMRVSIQVWAGLNAFDGPFHELLVSVHLLQHSFPFLSFSTCNMALFSPAVIALMASVLVVAGYLLYRAAIPTPIPGIPYVQRSATRPLGDFPDAIKYNAKTRELTAFLASKCVELNSPVVQVFLRPFSRPWVIIADSRECVVRPSRNSKLPV